jgi:hypothetical protein
MKRYKMTDRLPDPPNMDPPDDKELEASGVCEDFDPQEPEDREWTSEDDARLDAERERRRFGNG